MRVIRTKARVARAPGKKTPKKAAKQASEKPGSGVKSAGGAHSASGSKSPNASGGVWVSSGSLEIGQYRNAGEYIAAACAAKVAAKQAAEKPRLELKVVKLPPEKVKAAFGIRRTSLIAARRERTYLTHLLLAKPDDGLASLPFFPRNPGTCPTLQSGITLLNDSEDTSLRSKPAAPALTPTEEQDPYVALKPLSRVDSVTQMKSILEKNYK